MPRPQLNVLSLFTGAGGLDLGLERAGFEIRGCVERDSDCRATLQRNTDWPLLREGDAELVEPKVMLQELELGEGDIDLLAGGPPCQPFSKSGQWVHGKTSKMTDPRAKTLHAYFDILEATLPKVMLLENVKGLVAKLHAGSVEEHALDVLSSTLAAINTRHGTAYVPSVIHLDAAEYGVPQKRERVFVIATRDGRSFVRPDPTHGPRAASARRLTTAWDALGDLDCEEWDQSLAPTGTWADLLASIPEGRNYLHHTPKGDGEPLFGWRRKYWSFLLKLAKDRPSWTIQAQPGPATGPFHWRSRRLSVREMARLQSFPDHYDFEAGYQSARRQIGNAVPVAIGELLGLQIRRQALDDDPGRKLPGLPEHRKDCPPAEKPAPVPKRYLELRGEHQDHPGTGLGPRARLQATAAETVA